jgi:hypothetical protein
MWKGLMLSCRKTLPPWNGPAREKETGKRKKIGKLFQVN